jgi:hypothetical protein
MSSEPQPEPGAYKTKAAVNDLLGLSAAVGLIMEGIETRLKEDELDRALTDEQEERLRDLFGKLHQAADDVADFAREIAEDLRR